MSGFEPSPPSADDPRHLISSAIAPVYAKTVPWLFGLSLMLFPFVLANMRRASTPPTALIFVAGLLVAILARTALLAFLDTTSIPCRNTLYLSPAVPFLLLFIAAVPGLIRRS